MPEEPPPDLTPLDNPLPEGHAKARPALADHPRRPPAGRNAFQPFLRRQCGSCKTVLACEYGRRRKPMICPICDKYAPLVYLPPAVGQDLRDLPVAVRPGWARRMAPWLFCLPSFVLYGAILGLMASVWPPLHETRVHGVVRRLIEMAGRLFS